MRAVLNAPLSQTELALMKDICREELESLDKLETEETKNIQKLLASIINKIVS